MRAFSSILTTYTPQWPNRVTKVAGPSRRMLAAPEIPGADAVLEWFGYWPTFHDAEVLFILLDRSGSSRVAIHAFERSREVDATGYYVLTKHAVVTFTFRGFIPDREGITNVRIEYFNHQNVLSSASIEKIPEAYQLRLDGIYGVDATIVCEQITVALEPGAPERAP